jgi:hypothetical protein
MAVASTYSYGESVWDKFSSKFDGTISTLVRPICARSAFRRGDVEARITLLPRKRLSAGNSRGGGGLSMRRGVVECGSVGGTESAS